MAEKVIRRGKKRFYPILAPRIFNEQEIGEAHLYDLREAIGRRVKLNLMALTNDPKKQRINISFEITSVDGEKARAEVIGYNISPSAMRRMVRRKKIRMDDSFVVKTNDNKLVRIKPFLVTGGLARSSALKGLKRRLREVLTKNIAKMSYEFFLKELISHRLQSDLRAQLKKTYPLAICEIRAIEIEKEKKREVEEEKVEVKEVKKEVKEIKKEEKPVEKKEVKEVKKEEKAVSKK